MLGHVNIDAGRNALIKGFDLVAGGDIDVLAQNIRVEDVANRYQRDEKHEASKSGLTVALSGAVGSAANTAVQQAQELSEAPSGRLAALQGIQAGLSGYQAYQAYQQEMLKPAEEQSFVGVSLSVGVPEERIPQPAPAKPEPEQPAHRRRQSQPHRHRQRREGCPGQGAGWGHQRHR